jgi:hypothetical protein
LTTTEHAFASTTIIPVHGILTGHGNFPWNHRYG